MANRRVAPASQLREDNSALENGARLFIDGNIGYSDVLFQEVLGQYDNSQLATLLSGQVDKKSREYKASLRRVQVWRKTGKGPGKDRKGSTPYRAAITEIAKFSQISDASRVASIEGITKGAKITITGTKIVSKGLFDHDFYVFLGKDDLKDFLRFSLEENAEGALDVFRTQDTTDRHYPEFACTNNCEVFIEQ